MLVVYGGSDRWCHTKTKVGILIALYLEFRLDRTYRQVGPTA